MAVKTDLNYVKCPHCNCEDFTEFAIESTAQRGVRLTYTGGDIGYDYDNADDINGYYVEVTGYTCCKCETEYEFSEGILREKKETQNKDKERSE
ncbi:hypothetical protein [Candidatus Kuenenia stuttgartiensis]|uniref:Uncharacterized protein n=1 Tax=Kuenenia stuttgartiensis TaxID=174633 RepID=Q1Q5C9_KUEST|nr:hypothetical protein [Candidatus Kuenenia stuttgartiensis]CAJ75216.1 unknown protein [Candidatus Kuenenia stuttgartiensis]